MIKITNGYTNQLVYDFAVKENLGQYWIDGHRGTDDVPWVYNNGRPMYYSKWHPGEPNNFGGSENCIHGKFYLNGFWNDINCNIKIAVICYSKQQPLFTKYDLVVLSRSADYQTSVELCRDSGMDLVKIEEEFTNQVLYDYAVRNNLGQYWIDGNRGNSDVPWVFNDGSRMYYSKWQPGEPNNFGGSENCIHGKFYLNGFWNDINCNNKMTTICYRRR